MTTFSPYTIEDWDYPTVNKKALEIINAGHFVPAQSKATFETVEDMVIISTKKLEQILNDKPNLSRNE